MQQLISEFYANGMVLCLWGAVIFHNLLPIPKVLHPLFYWRKMAQLIAKRAIKKQFSDAQRTQAGLMSFTLLILPVIALLIAFQELVWQPAFYHLALLLLSLSWSENREKTKKLTQLLQNVQNQEAKAFLKNSLNRDTDRLSTLGLIKAGSESIIMGYAKNVVTVLFCFTIGGGIAAFTYRLISELTNIWAPIKQDIQSFGLPTYNIAQGIEYIPHRLLALLITAGRNVKSTIIQGNGWENKSNGWLLSSVAIHIDVALGGPVIYQGNKKARPQLGTNKTASIHDLTKIQTLITARIFVLLVIFSTLLLLIHGGV